MNIQENEDCGLDDWDVPAPPAIPEPPKTLYISDHADKPAGSTESVAGCKAVYEHATWLDVVAVCCAGGAGVYIIARLSWVALCYAIGRW